MHLIQVLKMTLVSEEEWKKLQMMDGGTLARPAQAPAGAHNIWGKNRRDKNIKEKTDQPKAYRHQWLIKCASIRHGSEGGYWVVLVGLLHSWASERVWLCKTDSPIFTLVKCAKPTYALPAYV